MKSNRTRRAKTNFSNDLVRIGTKISAGDYQILKLICGRQGWTLEERLAEVILKDVQYNMNTKWFREYVHELQSTSMAQMLNIMNGIKSGEIKIDEDGEDE
mgnify:CR=1 FL=1